MPRYSEEDRVIADESVYVLWDILSRAGLTGAFLLKGGLALKMYLTEYGVPLNHIQRMTTDIDFDYSHNILRGHTPQELGYYLRDLILQDSRFELLKLNFREGGKNFSLKMRYHSGGRSIRIGIDAHFLPENQYGRVSLQHMFNEKFKLNLSRTVLRRAKDSFDLYILSNHLRPYLDLDCLVRSIDYPVEIDKVVYLSNRGLEELYLALQKYTPKPVVYANIKHVLSINTSFVRGVLQMRGLIS